MLAVVTIGLDMTLSKCTKFSDMAMGCKALLFKCRVVFSTFTLKLRFLLDGESSQGRGSYGQEMALIHLIAI